MSRNKAQSTADGRHTNNRRRAYVTRITVGSTALAPATDASKLTISLYSQPAILGKRIAMPKKLKPAPKPEEAQPEYSPLWRNAATKKILEMYNRQKPAERQRIIEVQFARLCRFAA